MKLSAIVCAVLILVVFYIISIECREIPNIQANESVIAHSRTKRDLFRNFIWVWDQIFSFTRKALGYLTLIWGHKEEKCPSTSTTQFIPTFSTTENFRNVSQDTSTMTPSTTTENQNTTNFASNYTTPKSIRKGLLNNSTLQDISNYNSTLQDISNYNSTLQDISNSTTSTPLITLHSNFTTSELIPIKNFQSTSSSNIIQNSTESPTLSTNYTQTRSKLNPTEFVESVIHTSRQYSSSLILSHTTTETLNLMSKTTTTEMPATTANITSGLNSKVKGFPKILKVVPYDKLQMKKFKPLDRSPQDNLDEKFKKLNEVI